MSELVWRKSNKSANNGQCVEVAKDIWGNRYVRDSKYPEGPKLYFLKDEWDAFLDGAKNGEFDN